MAMKIVNGVEVAITPEEELEMARLVVEHEKVISAREKTKYKAQRSREYPPLDEVIVAMLEKYEENRPEAMKDIMAKRVAVKQKYPKPE